MAEIAVMIPAYNSEKYLPRALDSLLEQTFSDFVCLIVNDGSTDGTEEICDSYARRDSRIHVIHKKNEGVCVCRNTGLDWILQQTKAPWIFFLDNDDWLHPQTLERMKDAVRAQGTKVCICGYAETAGEQPCIQPEDLKPTVWKPKDFYMEHFVNATVCWGKLYHRSCFDGRRYPPGKYIEDEFLTYRILFDEESLSVISAPLYAYYYNNGGISKKKWTPKRLDAWEAYDQQIAFFQSMGDQELVRFRLRHFFESSFQYLEQAQTAPNAGELTNTISFMKKRIKRLIRQCYRGGCLYFWIDYDKLAQFYPLACRWYRFYLDHLRKL